MVLKLIPKDGFTRVTSLLNNISNFKQNKAKTERNRKKDCSSGKSKNEKLREEELHWGRNNTENVMTDE